MNRRYHPNLLIMAKTVGFAYLDTTNVFAVKKVGAKSSVTAADEDESDLLKDPGMSKEEQEFIALLNKLYPAKNPRTTLRDTQKDLVFKQEGLRNLQSVWDHSNDADKAKYRDWYKQANADCVREAERLASHFKGADDPLKIYVAVVAATSQGTLWEENIQLASSIVEDRSILDTFEVKKDKEDTAESAAPKITKQNLNRVREILNGNYQVVLTDKFGPFFESIIDPNKNADSVVVDSHMIGMWNGSRLGVMHEDYKVPSDAAKVAIARDVAKLAAKVGETPQSVQAITWSVWRQLPPGYRAGQMQHIWQDKQPEVEFFKALWPYVYPIKPGKRANWRYKPYKTGQDSPFVRELGKLGLDKKSPLDQQTRETLLDFAVRRDIQADEWDALVAKYRTDLNKFYGIGDAVWREFLDGEPKWRAYLESGGADNTRAAMLEAIADIIQGGSL